MDRELFSLEAAVDATGARFVGPTLNQRVGGVSIDTRTLAPGDLFVALPGETRDGHEFLDAAFAAGAAGAVVKKDYWEGFPAEIREAGPFILVEEPLGALQDLARMYLNRFPSLLKVAVTGSNGKTTTKEYLASILARVGPTYFSAGNFNSEIGLPLAVFGLREQHVFGVFELASNRLGEIGLLADILKPNIALVTNVGTAHIGMFGSREAIADEKGAVFSCFDSSSRGLVWEDDSFRARLTQARRGSFSVFGRKSTPGVEGFEFEGLAGGTIHYRGHVIRTSLPGEHNLVNACAAISAAQLCGADDAAITAGIEAVAPVFGRSELVEGEVSVYQDCYNANYESFKAGLAAVRQDSRRGRRIGVLGAMKELGSESQELHRRAGALCVESGFDAWFFLGDEARAAWEEYRPTNPDGAFWEAGFEALARELGSYVRPGDLVYLKGSRSMGLERLTGLIIGNNKGAKAC